MNKRQEIMGNALGDGRRALSKEVSVGYKRTEVGVIPEEWSFQSLGAICDVRDGTHESPRFYSEGVPFVTSKNIVNGNLDLENTSYISEQDANEINKRSKVDSNDILMSMIGTIGSAVLIDFEPNFCIKNVALIKPQKVLPKFLIQLIVSPLFQNYLKDSLDGGIQKFVALGTLRHLNVPLPSSSEQRAIAEALSDVDELLGSLEKLIAKKRAIKQAAMQQLLTGKTRLPGFNGAWETKRIADLLYYERPDRYVVQSTDYSDYNNVPVLTANKSFVLGYTDEDFGICTDTPVIVFDDFTTACKYATFPFKVKSSAIKLLRARHNHVDLRYVFERMQLIRFPLGDHKRYYISDYQNIELPIPDFIEQQVLASVFSDMDAEIAALERRRDKTRAIKQGMMQQLLTGRVRLVESEPDGQTKVFPTAPLG